MQFGTSGVIAIVLAKGGWSLEQIAIYEALLFMGGIYTFFWLAGGNNALLQLFPKLDSESGRRGLFNSFLLFTAAGILSGLLIYGTANLVIDKITKFSTLPYLGLLSVYIAINAPTLFIHVYYLLLGQFKKIILFGMIGFSLQLAAVAIPVLTGHGLKEVLYCLIAWASFKFVWVAVLIYRHTQWRLDPSFLRKYWHLALPLLLLAFIGKGSEYASTFLVTALFSDETAFAIYRYGAREIPLSLIMLSALATSLLPVASGNLEEGLKAIRKHSTRLAHFLFPVSIVLMVLSPVLFPLVFSPEFKPSAYIFNTLAFYLSNRILMPQVLTMARGHNFAVTMSALIEFFAVVLLCYLLGRSFGLVGIAMGSVLAFFVDRIYLIIYNWKKLGIHPSSYIDWRVYLVYNTLLIAAYCISFQM
jgi:O-antigen/teichoic acid export membrane protein